MLPILSFKVHFVCENVFNKSPMVNIRVIFHFQCCKLWYSFKYSNFSAIILVRIGLQFHELDNGYKKSFRGMMKVLFWSWADSRISK